MTKKIIVVTSGEPAGIGPDICLDLANLKLANHLIVVIGDYWLLEHRKQLLNKPVNLYRLNSISELQALAEDEQSLVEISAAPLLYILHIDCPVKDSLGKLNVANVDYVLTMLNLAIKLSQDGVTHAIVTSPVSKEIINQAGQAFSGHTEYLAQAFGNVPVVMMLANLQMKVALLTTHVALRDVYKYVTRDKLYQTLDVIIAEFQSKYAVISPKIAVCGLNPHAGEGGYLGNEEQQIINPVINDYRQRGFNVSGSYAADTIFNQAAKFDVILAMYHDQGLPVLKYSGFEDGINITLGLPIIRVSVDHGTALDLAGKNIASSGSLINAVKHVFELDSTTAALIR
jgi:4-hydroxythreonine-4-phosphate dehydrogenase